MSPESHTPLSRKAVRRNEERQRQQIEKRLGKPRAEEVIKLASRIATRKVIIFPVTETYLTVGPAPSSPEQS